MDINCVILAGRLASDPELRFIEGGTARLTVRIETATPRRGRDKKVTFYKEFHTVVVWGERAETVARELRKDDVISVMGELRTRSYDKDNIKRYRTEVVVGLGGTMVVNGRGMIRPSNDPPGPDTSNASNGGQGAPSATSPEDGGDDVPF